MDRVPPDFCERVAICIPQSRIDDDFRSEERFDDHKWQLAFSAIQHQYEEGFAVCAKLIFTAGVWKYNITYNYSPPYMTMEELTRAPDFKKYRIVEFVLTSGKHAQDSQFVDAPLETFLNFVRYLSNDPSLCIIRPMGSVPNAATVIRHLENVQFNSVVISMYYTEMYDNIIRHQVSCRAEDFDFGSEDWPDGSIAMIRDFIISGQMPFVKLHQNPPFHFDVFQHVFRNFELTRKECEIKASFEKSAVVVERLRRFRLDRQFSSSERRFAWAVGDKVLKVKIHGSNWTIRSGPKRY